VTTAGHAHSGGFYSPREEIVHAATHAVGVLLGVLGLVVLTALAAQRGDAWHVTGVAVYGGTMILLFLASTLYHGVTEPRLKHVLKQVDHAAIYFLIAGTYTPFCLVPLRGPWGWTLLGIVWALALIGAVVDVATRRRFKWISIAIYLGMGWLVVTATKPLLDAVDGRTLVWMLAGGAFYTGGVVFYLARRLPYHHAIWHVFVLGGGVCHWFAVYYGVIPPA